MEKLKEILRSMRLGKNTLFFLTMLFIGAAMYYVLIYVIGPFEPMSRFPAAILMMVVGVSAWLYFDRIHFSAIDTMKALRDGNVAYAIMMLSIAIIIAAVIMSV